MAMSYYHGNHSEVFRMDYVGVDWGDEAHHAYITDDSGGKLASFPIDHSEKGMSKLQSRVYRFS